MTSNKRAQVRYFPSKKKVKISANSTDFYPLYVKYLFEYLKIPQTATIIFNDRTIVGGVEKWLQE